MTFNPGPAFEAYACLRYGGTPPARAAQEIALDAECAPIFERRLKEQAVSGKGRPSHANHFMHLTAMGRESFGSI